MAIINCPECNEKISSSVNQCVHCGIKIAVCPECEKVYASHPEICSECGYVFKETSTKPPITKNKEKFTAPELKNRWKSNNIINTVIEYSDIILRIIGIAILIFGMIKILSWFSNLDLASAFEYSNMKKSFKTAFVFFVVFETLASMLKDTKPTITGIMLISWAGLKQISLIETIKNTFTANYVETTESEKKKIDKDLRFVIDTAFLSNDYLSKNKKIIIHAIDIILDIISDIFFFVFLWSNFEIFLDTIFLYGIDSWGFSMIENWWLLIGVPIPVLTSFFLNKAVDKAMNKKRLSWFEKTFPEASDDNKKYAISVNED